MEYIILLVSLAGIVFGADYLVAGAVSVARRFKVSDFVIGAAIVGVGTSMPELVVSFIGAMNGNPDVAIGNVVGSINRRRISSFALYRNVLSDRCKQD